MVKHTITVLVVWFCLSVATAGALFVEPAFSHYVEKLRVVNQIEAASLQIEQWRRQIATDQANIDAIEREMIEVDLTLATAWLENSGASVLDARAEAGEWRFTLTGDPERVWTGLYDLAGLVHGLVLSSIDIEMRSEGASIQAVLAARPPLIRYAGPSRFGEIVAVPFGGALSCPKAHAVSRLGDVLWVQDHASIQRIRLGEWLDQDWRLVGVHSDRLVLKSVIGSSCLSQVVR